MKNIIYFLIPMLLLSCSEKPRPKDIKTNLTEIVMHKGLHLDGKLAPENSLDAILLAGRVGAKCIEIDVNVTKDGEVILFHDLSINRLCYNASDYTPVEKDTHCNTLTLQELRGQYVLIAENSAMRRPVPTLKEALLLCREEGIYPYIEIKEGFFQKEDVKRVYELTSGILGKGNFAFTSFGTWIIEYLRTLDPEVRLYRDLEENTDFLIKNNVNYYPHYENIKEDIVTKMQQAGLSPSVWTVPKEEFDHIITKGFDGILTDDIAPMFRKEYAVYTDNSNSTFDSYSFDGTLENNIVHLKKDQTIRWKEAVTDSLYLGGMYFTVESKGKIAIKANGFDVERENNRDDYLLYRFQYLFHNERPYFEITALDDNVQIKSIWLAINNF